MGRLVTEQHRHVAPAARATASKNCLQQ